MSPRKQVEPKSAKRKPSARKRAEASESAAPLLALLHAARDASCLREHRALARRFASRASGFLLGASYPPKLREVYPGGFEATYLVRRIESSTRGLGLGNEVARLAQMNSEESETVSTAARDLHLYEFEWDWYVAHSPDHDARVDNALRKRFEVLFGSADMAQKIPSEELRRASDDLRKVAESWRTVAQMTSDPSALAMSAAFGTLNNIFWGGGSRESLAELLSWARSHGARRVEYRTLHGRRAKLVLAEPDISSRPIDAQALVDAIRSVTRTDFDPCDDRQLDHVAILVKAIVERSHFLIARDRRQHACEASFAGLKAVLRDAALKSANKPRKMAIAALQHYGLTYNKARNRLHRAA